MTITHIISLLLVICTINFAAPEVIDSHHIRALLQERLVHIKESYNTCIQRVEGELEDILTDKRLVMQEYRLADEINSILHERHTEMTQKGFPQPLFSRFQDYTNTLKTNLDEITQKLEDYDETITSQCNNDKLEIARYEQALQALDSAEHTMHHQDKVLKTIPGISSSRRSISSEFSSTEKKMIRGLQKQLKHLKKQYNTQLKKKTKQVKRLRKSVKVLQLQNDSYRKQQELCDLSNAGGAISMIALKQKNKGIKKKKKKTKKRKVNHIFCFKTVYEQRSSCDTEGVRQGSHSIDRCFGGKHECEKAREEVDTQSCERGTFPIAFQKPVEKGDCIRLKKPVAKPHFEKSLFRLSGVSGSR